YFGTLPINELLATKIPIDTGITAKVMAGESPVLINMDEEVKQGNKGPYLEFWKSLGDKKEAFRNLIGTPLRLGNKSLGTLWIVTSEINMAILEGICAQISVAISNIQSNEEIENREKEKSILLSISDEIAALRKTKDLLRVVNKQLKTLFSIEEFGFLQI